MKNSDLFISIPRPILKSFICSPLIRHPTFSIVYYSQILLMYSNASYFLMKDFLLLTTNFDQSTQLFTLYYYFHSTPSSGISCKSKEELLLNKLNHT